MKPKKYAHTELLSVYKEKVESIKQIKKACEKFNISFSATAVELIIIGFETGKWGVMLDKKHKKNIYSTADIVHDAHQDKLTGEETWLKL